jgi:uncharacterized Ntn-hydrolase superfamily protein
VISKILTRYLPAAGLATGAVCLVGCAAVEPSARRGAQTPEVATFSIVARDAKTGELGIAVQSRFMAVGAVVPWARGAVGAVATQALANPEFGPDGLKLLEQGKSPQEVLEHFQRTDPGIDERQVGIVDSQGRSATFTGKNCLNWAGGRTGRGYAVQGNILAGEAVVNAMAEAFEKAQGDLGSRLLEALQAGQDAGGDKRGMQAAALLIVHPQWGYDGRNDRYRDLRVDEHTDPIRELRRIYLLHRAFMPPREAAASGE